MDVVNNHYEFNSNRFMSQDVCQLKRTHFNAHYNVVMHSVPIKLAKSDQAFT